MYPGLAEPVRMVLAVALAVICGAAVAGVLA